MDRIVSLKLQRQAETGLLFLLLSFVFALIANFVVAFLAAETQVVAKPYDPGGLIFGTSLMTVSALIALISRKPWIVALFAISVFVWFFYWSGENWGIVLELAPYAVLLTVVSVNGAWFGYRSLRWLAERPGKLP